jgi:hypothetical protein
MYYIITDRDNVQKAAFVKYIPDAPTIFLDQENFTGKIQMFDTNLKIRLNSKFLDGKEQKQNNSTTARANDNCTSTTTIVANNCGDSGNHSPGTACDDGNYYSYYEILTTTTCFTSAYDNSAPLPNEFVNGSDGIGGGGANADVEILNFEMIYLDANQKMWWDNPDNLADKQIFMDYLNQNPTDEAKQMVSEMITQMNGGKFAPKFDVKSSLYSPMNIIKATIDTTTTEGKKFTEVYGALLTSPSFKEFFVDIFKDSERDNVEFEINDKVFEDNDPTKKEVNATTSFDPISKNIVIKINKKILIAGTTLSQTKIENAKTILHECIHAYLFIKANYPNTGVDFVNILNSMYPDADQQHDFMYNNMLPTMTKILLDAKSTLITQEQNTNITDNVLLPNFPAAKPMVAFNWKDCLENIALGGLQDCTFFQNEIGTFFPNGEPNIIKNVIKMNNYNQYKKLVGIWLK